MHAYVYKSQRKPDTYVYLAKRDDFDALPHELGTTLAPFSFVLEVVLTPVVGRPVIPAVDFNTSWCLRLRFIDPNYCSLLSPISIIPIAKLLFRFKIQIKMISFSEHMVSY